MSYNRISSELDSWLAQYEQYQPNDFESIYDEWIRQSFLSLNPVVRRKFFTQLDTWFFHTHAFLQGTSYQHEARERILTVGRVFDENIERVSDMKERLTVDQLTYIAEQQTTRGRFYSFAQGGLTGTGGWLFLGVDYPLMMFMNLRAVQLIGLTFGHEMNHPYEMMVSLKVFHAATLPKRLKAAAWDDLVKEIKSKEHPYIYEGNDSLTDEGWLEQPLKQCFKSLFILMFRKKLIQGLPFISIAIGAYSNFHLTKQVTEFAMKFYQYRFILEKEED
ncbi:EcsC family protein [Halobacillus sp. ACCC02827]|uniref:EcsC family protein n=1 Tax=Halobacillus sp. ACCC02827 TaxID=3052090 RepID=UPI0025704037|nr:EcsC family protein [Halobacillus sp. ACCC02827]WJE14645.1 EcsC family protein [Halobacillus sp. ACCC02827]